MSIKYPIDLSTNPLIGMIHLPPLRGSYETILEFSLNEAKILMEAQFDAILIENFHDVPYTKTRIDDEKFLLMGLIIHEIVSKSNIPCGINILRNACIQSLIMATITQASFIRCNIYEGAYITDQGIIEGAAYELQQKKREMQTDIKILADIHVKHAIPVGQFSLVESAKNALVRGSADSVIVSGTETGKIIDLSKLQNLVNSTGIKPILGSGLSISNLKTIFPYISGAIVGSSLKTNGDLSLPIDPIKAKNLVLAWQKERERVILY